MEQYQEHFEEKSDNEVAVEHEEVVVGVVAHQPVNIPLEVVVPGVADNPESPSPYPPPPSSELGSPQRQLGDAPNFLGFFTADVFTEIEQWAVDAQSLHGTPRLRLEEPEISANFKTFIKFTWGHQWELKFFQPVGMILICKLRAYLSGYNLLTSFIRRQWLRLFPALTIEEKREQLESLAGSGGFLDLWGFRALFWVVGRSRPAALLFCRVSVFVVKILELHKK